jgi:hypothetical protein
MVPVCEIVPQLFIMVPRLSSCDCVVSRATCKQHTLVLARRWRWDPPFWRIRPDGLLQAVPRKTCLTSLMGVVVPQVRAISLPTQMPAAWIYAQGMCVFLSTGICLPDGTWQCVPDPWGIQ